MKKLSIVLFILTLAVLGCTKGTEEKAAEKAIETATGKKVEADLSDGSVKLKSEDGTFEMTSGDSAELPEGFPKDVYVYENASIQMAMDMPHGMSVGLHTSDGVRKVSDAYKKAMEKEGWKKFSATDAGDSYHLVYGKEQEDRMAQITIAREDDKTVIALSISRKQ